MRLSNKSFQLCQASTLGFLFACSLVIFAASTPAAHATPKHDCCWGSGCPGNGSLTALVHASDTDLLYPMHCANYYFSQGAYHVGEGDCQIGNFAGHAWVWRMELDCNDGAGCTFVGNLMCHGTGGVTAPVSFTLGCPAGTKADAFDFRVECGNDDGPTTVCECDSTSVQPSIICGTY